MLETFRNAWKVEELRKKIIYTLIMLLVYRVGSVIPTPGVNVDYIAQTVDNVSMLGMLDFINGNNFSNFTIFAMGISPYITSSIIMQLLCVAIPALENLQKEGEEGRKKIAQITRLVTIALGCIMAIGIIVGLGSGAMARGAEANFFDYALVFLSLAAGTALTMWIGERITENGIGNGISLLIFVGIIASFPGQVYTGIMSVIQNPMSAWSIPLVLIGIIVLVVGIVFVDKGQRRIPVQYAKRMMGRKMYGGQSTHIPLKVNSSGVMPLIFAMSIIQFPGMIAQFWPTSGFAIWYGKMFAPTSWLYLIVYGLLIVGFTYFYSLITFNPIEMSKNLQQNGGFIPGIRPGKPTADYLVRISGRITLFGALFLAIIAVVPSAILGIAGVATGFTANGILIVVSVALETTSQLEAQMMMRHYKGFMK